MIGTNVLDWTGSTMLAPLHQDLLNIYGLKRTATRGEVIFQQGQAVDKVFLLLEGLVFIERKNTSKTDQILVTYIISPGETFAEPNLWTKSVSRTQAVVKSTSATFLQIEVSVLQKLIEEHDTLADFFMQIIFRRYRQLEDRCLALHQPSTRQRLKHLLLSFVRSADRNRPAKAISIHHNLSLKEMGNMVRSTAQTMSSILNDWRSKGILEFSKERVLITDYERFIKI